MSMNTLAQSPIFWFLLIGGLAFVYALPLIIALIRNVEDLGLVVIFNLFPVAWLGALILACAMPRKEPAYPPPLYYRPLDYPADAIQRW
jgi:hypothetical protein